MPHLDSPISYLSLLKTHKVELTKEDSWLISSILAIPLLARHSREALASSILQIFSGHSVLKRVKRISLVQRMGLANQLSVISSAGDPNVSNTMPTGYSCFVNFNGSLFSLKPHSARFYPNAMSVVKKFEEAGQPPQRSIARIAKMNLGGGICSAVWARNQIEGFVFLNGDLTKDDFDSDRLSLLLSIFFELVHKYYANATLSPIYFQMAGERNQDYAGRRFNSMILSELVQQYYFDRTCVEIEITAKKSQNKGSFLVSHGNLAQIISRVLAAVEASGIISVQTIAADGKIEFTVSNSLASSLKLEKCQINTLEIIKSDAALLGYSLDCQKPSEFRISLQADIASDDASIDYSVEF